MSVQADAIAALLASLQVGMPAGHLLTRATGTPETIPPGYALVTIHQGACEAAEPILSPLQYEIIWVALITIDAESDAVRDTAMQIIGARLLADPTLGGAVDWAEMALPETEVAASPALDGMGQQPPIFAATLPVRLHYLADSPAG
ncbi:MAG: hypothetical protein K5Q68_21485 [Roseococcus sp.]|nr:hypothetical protein [Roseococcus sp.]